MKTLFSILMLFFAMQVSYAQAPSCCEKPLGNDILAMAKTEAFRAAHEDPIPFTFQSDKGSMVQFETLDGTKGNAYYIPAKAPTTKVLLIFHEWWGLNDYIKQEAVRWQELLGDVDIYAVDLYDGKVAATKEEASKLSSGLDKTRTDNIIKGALVNAGKDVQIATLGWCLGGSYAFTASVFAGMQASGCVMYYGFPETDKKRIKPLKTDVLFIWASQDNFIKRPLVEALQTEVKNTGHKLTIETFDAAHAFANPTNPKHDVAASAKAEALSVTFLKEKLLIE